MFNGALRFLTVPALIWEKCRESIKSAISNCMIRSVNPTENIGSGRVFVDELKQEYISEWLMARGLDKHKGWVILMSRDKISDKADGAEQSHAPCDFSEALTLGSAKEAIAVALTNSENKICNNEDVVIFTYNKLEAGAQLFEELRKNGGVLEVAV